MTRSWDDLWPVKEPPDDFALRVVVASVKRQGQRRPGRKWLLAALACCLCVGLVFSLSRNGHQEEALKRASILEAQRRGTEERLRRLQNDFENANRREQELQASLANAKDEVARTKLQLELDATRRKVSSSATRAVKAGATALPARAKGASSCSPGDSLCDY